MKDRPLTDFDKTVLEQMEHIRAVGRRKLRNQNELDDFVQETIARVYANRAQLRDPAKLKQWIAGIARNVADDWNRAHYRRAEHPLTDEAELTDESDPLDALEQAERNELIRQAMNRLNPVDRDLLRGRYMDEESYADLQKRHGLSYSAVGIRLHRAKQRLKKIMEGMKIALVLPLVNLTRNAFGGIVLMTKSTKIVLGITAVLILALLGGYLWLEYGGSSNSETPGLTIEEQTPPVETSASNDGASNDGVSTQTETANGADSTLSSDAPQDAGETPETLTAPPPEAAPADVLDDFANQLLEGIQEVFDFAKKLKAHSPELTEYADVMTESMEDLANLDAQLRRQGASVEERKAQVSEKYFVNVLDRMIIHDANSASVKKDAMFRSAASSIGIPSKLEMLLMGGMTPQDIMRKIQENPEYRAKWSAAQKRANDSFQGKD